MNWKIIKKISVFASLGYSFFTYLGWTQSDIGMTILYIFSNFAPSFIVNFGNYDEGKRKYLGWFLTISNFINGFIMRATPYSDGTWWVVALIPLSCWLIIILFFPEKNTEKKD